MRRHALFLLMGLGLFLSNCGQSGDGSSGRTSGSSNTGQGGAAGNGGNGQGGTTDVGGGFVTSGTGANGSSSGGGGPEVCDGIDNDNDGVIDNVDIGGDGVCDCLRIATLGLAGPWGEGDVFAQWLDARSDNGAVGLNDVELTKDLLDKYQVIVAQDLSKMNRTYSAAEVTALNDWVKAGGGFMTLIGYGDPSERTNANTLLGSFTMGYDAAQILPASGGNTYPITNWMPHPVSNGVNAIGVDNGYPVTGMGQTIATAGGYDVLKAQEVGDGHVLVWADEWLTYDSEWTGHPEYQLELFWLNSIKWLTAAKNCQVNIPPPK